MARALIWRLVLGALLLLGSGCAKGRWPPWGREGCLICSRGDAVVRLSFASGQVDTVFDVGIFYGPHTGVTQLDSATLVFGGADLRPMESREADSWGSGRVVVYDMHDRRIVATFPGIRPCASNDPEVVVFWRLPKSGAAELLWCEVSDSLKIGGRIGRARVPSPDWLAQPVLVAGLGVVAATDAGLLLFDARSDSVQVVGDTTIVPLTAVGSDRLLCRVKDPEELVLLSLEEGAIIRRYKSVHGLGWSYDALSGDVVMSVPASEWWRSEEWDLASFDLRSGAVKRGTRGFLMMGGVVVPCAALSEVRR